MEECYDEWSPLYSSLLSGQEPPRVLTANLLSSFKLASILNEMSLRADPEFCLGYVYTF